MGKRDLNECISIDIEPLCVRRKRKTERASKKEGDKIRQERKRSAGERKRWKERRQVVVQGKL